MRQGVGNEGISGRGKGVGFEGWRWPDFVGFVGVLRVLFLFLILRSRCPWKYFNQNSIRFE